MVRKHVWLIVALLLAIILAGCEKEELSSTEIKEMVQKYSTGQIENETASITSKEMIVTDSDGKEKKYPLPKEEFFVSVAPFIENTHPCRDHSLTGCQGEMANEEFSIKITDKDGTIVINDVFKSGDNGFIDLWLPRNKTFDIKIESDGKVGSSTFSTFEQDGTCITDIQLL